MPSFIVALVLFGSALLPPQPSTRVDEVVDTLHGQEVADPYRWLESGDHPEVLTWTDQQNAHTRSFLDAQPGASELRQRLNELYQAATLTSPRVVGSSYFFFRQEGGQDQPILYVKQRNLNSEAREVLNPNDFGDDSTVAIDWWYPSPDGRLIAYGRSSGGDEMSTLYLRDVTAAADTSLQIPRTRSCSVAWDPDSKGFHYVQYPAPGSVPEERLLTTRLVRYHRFGTAVDDDPIVFGEDALPNTWHDVYDSSDFKYQFLAASLDWSRNHLYMRRNVPGAAFQQIADGETGQFEGEVLGDKLLLLTSDGAPRRRVLAADLSTDESGTLSVGAERRELIPQQSGVIENMLVTGDSIVLHVLENAYSRLLIYDAEGKDVHEVALPTLGTVTDLAGQPGKQELIYRFESFAYPPTLFRYDLGTHETATVEQTSIEADLAAYETRQEWFESPDGTRVPMFLIHRKGLTANAENPTVLYGYGGFGVNMVPRFRRDLLPWLDAGGVYASANLRGGGEFGQDWHMAGRLERKQNVFDDMIAAAEHLVETRVTSPEHLGIMGGSNGGLLVGAVMTQRPDLCSAVYCAVPLLDMLRYHKFLIGRLWIPEYGSADNPAQFPWLYAYSPYHQVKPDTDYPATFITTAEFDSRVDPLHARKMAARLQANTQDKPVLLWIERKAGHGKGKPLAKQVEAKVDQWTFFRATLQ